MQEPSTLKEKFEMQIKLKENLPKEEVIFSKDPIKKPSKQKY